MAYRKKTLRSLSPVTRKLARLIGEMDSISRRSKNLLVEIQRLEADSRALQTAKQVYPEVSSIRMFDDPSINEAFRE